MYGTSRTIIIMPLTIIASAAPRQRWEQFKQKLDERRMVVESARNMNVKRVQTHVQRIAKKEMEFVASLWDEIVPVKATWNEEALTKFSEMLPVRIEPKTKL